LLKTLIGLTKRDLPVVEINSNRLNARVALSGYLVDLRWPLRAVKRIAALAALVSLFEPVRYVLALFWRWTRFVREHRERNARQIREGKLM
jgi:hypothetical protein